MGAGKTTLGKKLAKMLSIDFIDTDLAIEEKYGMRIGELFTLHGEGYFRELERELIHELYASNFPYVLSTGGGLPCYQNNMSTLNELGITFYLQRTPKELAHRLKNAKAERPLIKGMDELTLQDYIIEKLTEREEFYRKAQFILDRDQQDAATIIQLLKLLHRDQFQKS